jgi:hypothetical protein
LLDPLILQPTNASLHATVVLQLATTPPPAQQVAILSIVAVWSLEKKFKKEQEEDEEIKLKMKTRLSS